MKTAIIVILVLVIGLVGATVVGKCGGDDDEWVINGVGKVSEDYHNGYWHGFLDGSTEGWQRGFSHGKEKCTVLAPGTHTLECSPCPPCEKCSYWIKVEEDGHAYYVNLAVSSIGLDGVRYINISKDDRQ